MLIKAVVFCVYWRSWLPKFREWFSEMWTTSSWQTNGLVKAAAQTNWCPNKHPLCCVLCCGRHATVCKIWHPLKAQTFGNSWSLSVEDRCTEETPKQEATDTLFKKSRSTHSTGETRKQKATDPPFMPLVTVPAPQANGRDYDNSNQKPSTTMPQQDQAKHGMI